MSSNLKAFSDKQHVFGLIKNFLVDEEFKIFLRHISRGCIDSHIIVPRTYTCVSESQESPSSQLGLKSTIHVATIIAWTKMRV